MTVVTALLVKTFILDATYIPSRSMMDALQPGDFVLVNKFLYGARLPPGISAPFGPLPSVRLPAVRDPRRGDILVFLFPAGEGSEGFRSARQFVKRCVAIPGDTLVIETGSVQVNGRAVARLEDDTSTQLRVVIPGPGETVGLSAGTPVILRDLVRRDRLLSGEEQGEGTHGEKGRTDVAAVGHSDAGAPPDRDEAAGPATDSHTVSGEFYFVLGDRTPFSVDSRHWGLVPRAWVIGTPMAVYWSADPDSADGGVVSRVRGIRWSRLGRLIR